MNMKKFLLPFLMSFTAGFVVAADAPKTIREVADSAQAHTYAGGNGFALPYRMLSPEIKKGEKYPLVVFLHGAGERGANNVSQLSHADVLKLMYENTSDGILRQVSRKAFVIFPQCRKDSQWVLVPWDAKKPTPLLPEPSADLANVHELVAKLKGELPIDEKRIYVTGISMGGYGTWDYITRWPDEVAAAIVVCGGADNTAVGSNPKVNTIPIRIYHGSLDTAVPVERGRDAFAAVRNVNHNATYIEYGKAGHCIWSRAYAEPGLGEWLFRHVRKPAPAKR